MPSNFVSLVCKTMGVYIGVIEREEEERRMKNEKDLIPPHLWEFCSFSHAFLHFSQL